MPISGYTDAAFTMGMFNMPSQFKSDYRQGSDGLWYFKGGDTANRATPSPAAQAGTAGGTGGTAPSPEAAAAAGAEATRLVRAGETAVGAATATAAQNLQTVAGDMGLAAAQSNADLNTARSAGASLSETAGQLGGLAGGVMRTAGEIGETADIFAQYADTMARDAAFARANALPWLNAGNDLLSMNPNAGGMAGEFASLYRQMSPDAMAAGAATSTRKAADVAQKDMLMSLARRGISAGSGAVAAALGKIKEREEASVAAMMTAARKTGLSMQADALKSGFAMALQASGMGKTFSDEAINATVAAADAQGKATSALTAKGSLEAQAANIVATQGNMYATAGNLAMGIASNVSNAATGRANALTAATNTQVNAQAVAADYYSTQGGSLLSMLTQQKYNVLTALFGKA
jgi:hypothetical protein